jgi:hypothetical protein
MSSHTLESLHKEFLKLRDITGATKMSSYSMTVYFSPDEDISIELGGYDIADWNRHEVIGMFKSEKEAIDALYYKVLEAQKLVNEGNYDD